MPKEGDLKPKAAGGSGERARGSLDPAFYLSKAEELAALIASGQTEGKKEREIAVMLDINKDFMRLARGLMQLDDQVKRKVADGQLSVDLGATIGLYERELHAPFAEGLEDGRLTSQDFTTYGRIQGGRHKPASLKARVDGVGLTWPAGLADVIDPRGVPDANQ